MPLRLANPAANEGPSSEGPSSISWTDGMARILRVSFGATKPAGIEKGPSDVEGPFPCVRRLQVAREQQDQQDQQDQSNDPSTPVHGLLLLQSDLRAGWMHPACQLRWPSIIGPRAPVAQWIERRPPEPKVAGSNPVRRATPSPAETWRVCVGGQRRLSAEMREQHARSRGYLAGSDHPDEAGH